MSHKIIHLTTLGSKVAVNATSIVAVMEIPDCGCKLYLRGGEKPAPVDEPYDQVFRMWADALSE